MLVPSYFQISPKSRHEIQTQLQKAGREIRIDSDDRREGLGQKQKSEYGRKKREKSAVSGIGKTYAEVHEVYNKKAEIVRVASG
ncbi:hypothetical protein [Desulfonatronospira sp. MSAO_Bac3]|uniref:hypothetical protein n=1 Tax=Desulfonatronospira sp. MSAO_Bac3 TaxID=2293857 RepID=UPI000FF29E5A|nr:hypothetical protein [Desulfonatronospira sp. MSAO_Bac3]RQD75922.1 MAG: hypothetical protein D5S03_07355 [Desulfonatronospira sp. MSAO_Bac3]